MRALMRFSRETLATPYYRRHPLELGRHIYATAVLRRARLGTAEELLQSTGADPTLALQGWSMWCGKLTAVVEEVWAEEGQGGVSLEDGKFLFGLTRFLRPEIVIETGVAAGVSSSFIGAALLENDCGRLYSIELPPENLVKKQADGSELSWHTRGVGWAIPDVIREGLGGRRNVILQDVRETLPNLLAELRKVDLFLHDDLHTPNHMDWEYELVWPYISHDGALVSDDANHGWLRFCRRHSFSEDSLRNVDRLTVLRKGREVQGSS